MYNDMGDPFSTKMKSVRFLEHSSGRHAPLDDEVVEFLLCGQDQYDCLVNKPPGI